MNKLTIALCDDDDTAVTIIGGTLKSLLDKKKVDSEIFTFLSVDKLKESMLLKKYDLILLDISMKETDGIKFAKELRNGGDKTEIAFVSSREDRVFDSFKVHPFAFVRKRMFIADVEELVEHFLETYKDDGVNNAIIELKTSTDVVHLNIYDIIYIESFREQQSVYLVNKESPVILNSTMNYIEEQLLKYGFVRIHKSVIVNQQYISRINACELVLSTGQILYIASKRAKQVRDEYMAYNRNKVSAMFKLKK